jgi:hypothetical protein
LVHSLFSSDKKFNPASPRTGPTTLAIQFLP